MTDSQPVPEQQLQNPEVMQFQKKFRLLGKRGFKLSQERKRCSIPAPRPTPIYKLSMMSMIWNISMGQLGYLSGCAPSQLHTC